METGNPITPEIRKLYIAIENMSNQFLKKFDVTFSQSIAIFSLLENEENGGAPMTQRDLERLMSMSNPSVAGVVKRLEEKGFLRRVKQGKDMRFNYLVPTEQSVALKKHLYPFLVGSEARILSGFTDEERELFAQFIERARKNTEE